MMTSNATHSNILKPAPALEDMSLTEIVNQHLKTCVKSNGLVSKCIACKDKCVYGKRAEDLAKGLVSPGMNKPVAYEGSMLHLARMQNELDRMRKAKNDEQQKAVPAKKEPEKKEEKTEEPKKQLKRGESFKTWFEDSLKAPDQIAWVMEHFNISKTKAKNKIYQVTYSNDEAREMVKKYRPQNNTKAVEPEQTKEEPVVETTAPSEDELLRKAMERKLEMLMNQQESVEADLKKYQDEFERRTKEAHDRIVAIKDQIDTICKTMDILKTI